MKHISEIEIRRYAVEVGTRQTEVQRRLRDDTLEMPNGNMVIHGRQQVRVSNERRDLEIGGIIRPEDISIANAITYDKIAEKKSGRLTRDCHFAPRIRNESALQKPIPPTGPGAATVDRAKARMCVTRKGGEPRTLPKTKPI